MKVNNLHNVKVITTMLSNQSKLNKYSTFECSDVRILLTLSILPRVLIVSAILSIFFDILSTGAKCAKVAEVSQMTSYSLAPSVKTTASIRYFSAFSTSL